MKSRKFGIYWRCWLVFWKFFSKGFQWLEKYLDEKLVCFWGCFKVIEISNVKCVMWFFKEIKWQVVVIIFIDDLVCIFICDLELEVEEWYKILFVECLGFCFNDISLGEFDFLVLGVQCEQIDCFNVFLLFCFNLDVYGECKLQIIYENIYFWDIYNFCVKFVLWFFCLLCCYGWDVICFIFEVGWMCDVGEGFYIFQI